ncbi:MAG: class I SAM-dependent methyltransferase [Mycobacteriales bacterium]
MTQSDLPTSAAVYSPFTLALYDLIVVHLSCRFVWRCPSVEMLALYNRNTGASHLDVGPGTGYFLDHATFPVPRPEITLVDCNLASLRSAARRIKRYSPRTIQADALQPLPMEVARFDSAAANFLLHCLPGALHDKTALFDHLKHQVKPGGKVFGSTILGRGVEQGWLGRKLMRIYNSKGIFSNTEDSLDVLDKALAASFRSYRLRLAGTVAMFEAVV